MHKTEISWWVSSVVPEQLLLLILNTIQTVVFLSVSSILHLLVRRLALPRQCGGQKQLRIFGT